MFGGFGGSLFREMDNDQFFSHRAHMEHMQRMFQPQHQYLPAPAYGSQHDTRVPRQDMMMMPFGGFNMFGDMFSPFRNMDTMFNQMHTQMGQISNDPNSHSFSSSTVMSYSNNGQGPPQVYQASSQTRTAPGGIKETRRMERDSARGTDKLALGHHINDRGHVIERARARNGDMDESNNYYNLDESEADAFNQEWQQKTSQAGPGIEGRHRAGRHRSQAALPAPPANRHRPRRQDADRPDRD